jgi:ABC transporter transmembrane region/Transposase IS116/IS110/IS902 family
MLHTAIGCGRQMYDTRLYTEIYNTIVIDTVLRQRQAGIEPTKVAARSAMSREFVTFFEKDMPVVLNTLVSTVGSAAILFYYDLVIGAIAALLFIPVAIINRRYMRLSLMLNEGLNNQLEQEVQAFETAREEAVARHFADVRAWRVKLSDADAFNWTATEGLSILVFLLVLPRVTYLPNADVGTIFCEQIVILHRRLLAIVRDDEVCRRLMTTPGVGPVVALTYRATVDVPARFRKSKAVGAVFGLTCSKYQSGEIDRSGARSVAAGGQQAQGCLMEPRSPDQYYVESYDPNGTKAKGHWTYSDAGDALALVKSIIAEGDIARIRCPPNTDPEYIQTLQQLGAQRF